MYLSSSLLYPLCCSLVEGNADGEGQDHGNLLVEDRVLREAHFGRVVAKVRICGGEGRLRH